MQAHYVGMPGIPNGPEPEKRIRCTRQEFAGMALAGRVYHACQGKLGQEMEERLRQTPGAWRNWRAACAMMGRAMDAIYRTVPDDQFERLWALFNRGEIDIHMPRASDYGGDLLIVHGDALMQLAHAAMRAECRICIKEDGQVRTCPLRKALDGVLEPDTWDTSTCAWRDQALKEI